DGKAGAANIASINPTTQVITEYSFPATTSNPYKITAGRDGNLWFTDAAQFQIGSFNLSTHAISETPTPTPSSIPYAITPGPDGNLWFTEYGANKIGQVVPFAVTATFEDGVSPSSAYAGTSDT